MNEGETRDPSPPNSERIWDAAGEPTVVNPKSAPEVHGMVGPYRIIREIGHGGLGYVLLGFREDDQFRKRVAVKLVKKGMDTADILRRFEQERQVLSALNHPNIARVFDAGQTTDGRPYFVMEYIEGQPIDDYCDSAQMPTAERLAFFLKVCAAVQYAHQNLIVHRDIKPTNILVGADAEPKLLDFGIAKLLNPDLFASPVTTGPELRLMTPEYASPEQVQGKPISTASDTYSLGVLLYELLTGQPPYQLKSRLAEEVRRVICEVEPERPSTAITKATDVTTRDGKTKALSPEQVAKLRDSVPSRLKRKLAGDIDNIVLMAVRKTPRRRYASVEQFAEDIRRHLDGKTVIARKETAGYVLGKFVMRNRGAVGAGALIFLSLAGGLALAVSQRNVARNERAAAVESKKIAEQARAEAVARYAQILGLADGQLKLQRRISDQIGSTPAQRILVLTTVEMLKGFQALTGRDAALDDLVARSYSLLGTLQMDGDPAQDPAGPEGPTRSALQSYEQSLQIRRALATQPDADRAARIRVGLALLEVAGAEMKLKGMREQARGHIAEAREIAVAAEVAGTPDRDSSGLFAVLLRNEGQWHQRGTAPADKDAAGKAFDEGLRRREMEVETNTQDPARLGALASAHLDLGLWLKDSGDYSKAEPHLRDAARLRQSQVKLAPDSAAANRGLFEAEYQLGEFLVNAALRETPVNKPRFVEAHEHLDRAGKTAIFLSENDPGNQRAARAVSSKYESMGDLYYTEARALDAAGDEAGAIARHRHSLESLHPFLLYTEAAHKADGESVPKARAYAVALSKVADAYHGIGDIPDAITFYKDAIAIYEGLIAASSESGRAHLEAGACLLSLAQMVGEGADVRSDAIRWYSAAIAHFDALAGSGQNPEQIRKKKTIACRNVGYLLLDDNRPSEAAKRLEEAVATMDETTEKRKYKVLDKLANAYENLGDLAKARSTREDAVRIYDALKDDDKNLCELQRVYQTIREKLGLPRAELPPCK